MPEQTDPWWLALIKLLRGNLDYRFAVWLVRLGAVLVAGPPIGWMILSRFFDIALPPVDDGVDIMVQAAPPVVGLLMICAGILVYLTRSSRRPLPQSMTQRTIAGQTFRSAVKQAAEADGKAFTFEGFDEEELKRPLKAGEPASDTVEAFIKALRPLVRGDPPFPRFGVRLEDGCYHVRKTDGE